MSYRVVYTEQFHAALDAQLSYFREQKAPPTRIAVWVAALLDLVDSLEEFPHRHPIAELETAIKSLELRKIVFGDYLVFYHVDEERRTVQILGFRHGRRRPPTERE